MRLSHKIILGAVVLTVATGSFAWINTAKDVAESTVEIVSNSGVLDTAIENIKSYIEENFTDEDGNIYIPKEKLESVINFLSQYINEENIQAAFDSVGIDLDVSAIADGDLSSAQNLLITSDEFDQICDKLSDSLSED